MMNVKQTFVLVMLSMIYSVLGWAETGWAEMPGQDPGDIRLLIAAAPTAPERGGKLPARDMQDIDVGGARINWSKLDLSREQKSQLVEKRREFQIETAALREELKFVEQDLRIELTKEPADRARIDALLNAITSLKHQISQAAVENLLEIKRVLTSEQVEKLAETQLIIPRDLQALQLTTEQRKKVHQILKTSVEKSRQASEHLRFLRAELQELLLLAQDIDRTQINQVQQAITEQEMVLERNRVDVFLQLREVLTPEQRERYQKLRTHHSQAEGDKPYAQDGRRAR